MHWRPVHWVALSDFRISRQDDIVSLKVSQRIVAKELCSRMVAKDFAKDARLKVLLNFVHPLRDERGSGNNQRCFVGVARLCFAVKDGCERCDCLPKAHLITNHAAERLTVSILPISHEAGTQNLVIEQRGCHSFENPAPPFVPLHHPTSVELPGCIEDRLLV